MQRQAEKVIWGNQAALCHEYGGGRVNLYMC